MLTEYAMVAMCSAAESCPRLLGGLGVRNLEVDDVCRCIQKSAQVVENPLLVRRKLGSLCYDSDIDIPQGVPKALHQLDSFQQEHIRCCPLPSAQLRDPCSALEGPRMNALWSLRVAVKWQSSRS